MGKGVNVAKRRDSLQFGIRLQAKKKAGLLNREFSTLQPTTNSLAIARHGRHPRSRWGRKGPTTRKEIELCAGYDGVLWPPV